MVERLVATPAGPGISFACGRNPRHEHRTAVIAQLCSQGKLFDMDAIYDSPAFHPCAGCDAVLIHRDEVLCSECDETCIEGPREGAIVVRERAVGLVVCERRATR